MVSYLSCGIFNFFTLPASFWGDMTIENPRLLKALERKKKVEESIKKIKAQQNADSRKLETRRKILLGVVMEKMLVDGCVLASDFEKYLTKALTERDQAFFENYLDSLTSAPSPIPEESQPTNLPIAVPEITKPKKEYRPPPDMIIQGMKSTFN
jgi:hypothetical protein